MIKAKTILSLVLVIMLSSCTIGKVRDAPYGIWYSQAPEITLYIDPEEKDNPYGSMYVLDGIEENAWVTYDTNQGRLIIYKGNAHTLGESGIKGDDEYVYFDGNYDIKDGKLYYTISPRFEERVNTGYTEIVFEKIGDY